MVLYLYKVNLSGGVFMKNKEIIEEANQYIELAKNIHSVFSIPKDEAVATFRFSDPIVYSCEIPKDIKEALDIRLGGMLEKINTPIENCRIDKYEYSSEPKIAYEIMDKWDSPELSGYCTRIFTVMINKQMTNDGQQVDRIHKIFVGDVRDNTRTGIDYIELDESGRLSQIRYVPEIETKKEKQHRQLMREHFPSVPSLATTRSIKFDYDDEKMKRTNSFVNMVGNLLSRNKKGQSIEVNLNQ